jgi:predicted CoA-substrate-specific enzyme activase
MQRDACKPEVFIALDAGTHSTKAVALDGECRVLRTWYVPIRIGCRESVSEIMADFSRIFPPQRSALVAVTGAHSARLSAWSGVPAVSEVMSTLLGAHFCLPQAGAVLDIGSEHARFLVKNAGHEADKPFLRGYRTNDACMAGSGAFLEQETRRLGIALEELESLARQSTEVLPVAGRCAVFAKSDLVHHAQNGAAVGDLAAALCRVVAVNVCNSLLNGEHWSPPLLFIGGVARNRAVRQALCDHLHVREEDVAIPSRCLYVNALGAALFALREKVGEGCMLSEVSRRPPETAPSPTTADRTLPRLTEDEAARAVVPGKTRVPVSSPDGWLCIGLDIGSTVTKCICLDERNRVAFQSAAPTAGQPLDAARQTLHAVRDALGSFRPKAVGVTGSGRKLIASLWSADTAVNEITAHAAGASEFLPEVDTVFDVGGQDSKFIRVESGAVTDFAMNKVCAAGTGSFLEEIAALLDVDVRTQFADYALRSLRPLDLGERCTVFMASELRRRQEAGCAREDLLAGLSYSIAQNYLTRVVGRHKIGRFISFQGGVAGNRAVVLALQNLLDRPLHVHPHHEMAGAIGAALIAQRRAERSSRFVGFDQLTYRTCATKFFVCRQCASMCNVRTTSHGGQRYYAGALCDRFDAMTDQPREDARTNGGDILEFRRRALEEHVKSAPHKNGDGAIGIPRALLFQELLPFWTSFLNELGVAYVLSDGPSAETVRSGTAECPWGPCLPVKIAHGLCRELISKGIRRLFVPCTGSAAFQTCSERLSHVCPAVQAWPYHVRSTVPESVQIINPVVRMSMPNMLRRDVIAVGRQWRASARESLAALECALESQQQFYRKIQDHARRVLQEISPACRPVLVLSRPYTFADDHTQLRLKRIFESTGLNPVPLDAIPTDELRSEDAGGMYWFYGKRLLQAAKKAKSLGTLPVIHLSNFGCGADSFLVHFLRRELAGHPFLELQLDEHRELTGLHTRVEAFADSLDHRRASPRRIPRTPVERFRDLPRRRLLIPQMSDHAHAVAAAFRAFGVSAEVLPPPDDQSLSAGKRAVEGDECFPCVAVLGDMLRHCHEHPCAKEDSAFFMIAGDGPCRLGQYPFLQRLVLDEAGLASMPIFNASQDPRFYERLKDVAGQLQRTAWKGIVASDLLHRKWRESRPYAENRSAFDHTYERELRNIAEAVSRRRNLCKELGRSFDALENIVPASPLRLRIPIAVLGENYVRCNRATGYPVADQLENLGAEVWFPSLYEWVYYTNWTARLHCRYERDYRRLAKLCLTDLVQRYDQRRLTSSVRGRIRNLVEPTLSQVFRDASHYVAPTLEGETVLSIARTIDYFRKHTAGAIHIVPFGCIVGSIVEGFSRRLSQDLDGFPILTLHIDGQPVDSLKDTLEAFYLRALAWKENNSSHP